MTQTIAEALAEMDRERRGAPPIAKGITAEEAAAIAKENGLGLADAAALRQMAVSVDEAKKIAATFKPESMRQLTRADLAGMSADEIVEAQKASRLKDLLSGTGTAAPAEQEPPEGQLSRKDMLKLTPEQREKARADGKLDWILGIARPVKK